MTPTQSIEKELGVKVAGWHLVDPAALDDALTKCARQPAREVPLVIDMIEPPTPEFRAWDEAYGIRK